jgi:hypothetical protein
MKRNLRKGESKRALKRKLAAAMALNETLTAQKERLERALARAEAPHWLGCRYCRYTGLVDQVDAGTGEVRRVRCPRCMV